MLQYFFQKGRWFENNRVVHQFAEYNENNKNTIYDKNRMFKWVELIKFPEEIEYDEGLMVFGGRIPSSGLQGAEHIASNN